MLILYKLRNLNSSVYMSDGSTVLKLKEDRCNNYFCKRENSKNEMSLSLSIYLALWHLQLSIQKLLSSVRIYTSTTLNQKLY